MAITVYTYNDKVLKNVATDKWLKKPEGPIIVDPGVLRVKMPTGWTLSDFGTSGPPGMTFTSLGNDVWDCKMENPVAQWVSYTNAYHIRNQAVEWIAINTTGDNSHIKNISSLFGTGDSTTTANLVKLYPANYIIDNITDVSYMLAYCRNIDGNILELYNKLSPISSIKYHGNCFTDCGSNTVTGAAELAQIPASWGGTAT